MRRSRGLGDVYKRQGGGRLLFCFIVFWLVLFIVEGVGEGV
jgi:hypothetical protein